MIAAVPLVAAWGFDEPMVCLRLTLPEPALEILEWRKTVLVDKADATPNKVILNGRLRTRCLFVSQDSGEVPPAPGTVTACQGLVAEAAGTVRMAVADFGFVALIRAPRAGPGMRVSVVDAYVSGENARPVALSQEGLITHVLDQSVLFVSVNVLTSAEVCWPEPLRYRPPEPVWREVKPEVVTAAAAEPVLGEMLVLAAEPVAGEPLTLVAEPAADEMLALAPEPTVGELLALAAESPRERAPVLDPEPGPTPSQIVRLVSSRNETLHRPSQATPPPTQRQLKKRQQCGFTWVNPLQAVPNSASHTHTQRK